MRPIHGIGTGRPAFRIRKLRPAVPGARSTMEILILLGVIAAYFALQAFILPRLGVST